ncbi:hypothetical protein [Asaia platycodi]|uniref:hypothetical protein n=1 Tax=Asaia platycodi TaxID=610243 RepID=UPI000A8369DC|nr:hypothetical protein [Asaia platycodi]
MNNIVTPDLGALQKEAVSVTLPTKMNAVVAYEPGDYRWEEVDVPRAGPDDIIIEVEALVSVQAISSAS